MIRDKKLLLLAAFAVFFLFCNSADAQQINWLTDYKSAQSIAAETGKPMLLDFTADWCKPCRVMERDFWTKSELLELAEQFVCVKIDYDKSKDLVNKYGVGKLPNVFITDSWGFPLNFHRGFSQNAAAEITEKLLAVPKDFSEIKEAHQKLAANGKNKSALNQIANFYQQRNFYYLSSEFYDRLLKLEKNRDEREKLLLILAENYLQVGWHAEAVKMFESVKKEFPASRELENINRQLINLNSLIK